MSTAVAPERTESDDPDHLARAQFLTARKGLRYPDGRTEFLSVPEEDVQLAIAHALIAIAKAVSK